MLCFSSKIGLAVLIRVMQLLMCLFYNVNSRFSICYVKISIKCQNSIVLFNFDFLLI